MPESSFTSDTGDTGVWLTGFLAIAMPLDGSELRGAPLVVTSSKGCVGVVADVCPLFLLLINHHAKAIAMMATTGTATPTPILVAELSLESDKLISAGEPSEFTRSVDVACTVTVANTQSAQSHVLFWHKYNT